jgi:hypothetical protein
VFVEEDGRPGGSFASNDVIILSYGVWQAWFGGREDAVGNIVRIGGKPLTVIGVMPKAFAFPDRETRAWTPWAVAGVMGDQGARRVAIFSALARLRPGATAAQASAEGTSRARSAPDPGLAAVAMFGGNGPAEITATPAIEMMTAEVRPALLVLLAAIALVLVTATANVASLQLARAAARRREIAIRAAIGAGPTRLAQQLFVESAAIGTGGGAAGLALAVALHRALPWLLPPDFPRVADVGVDVRVLGFAVAVTMLATVGCGLLPALNARRVNLPRRSLTKGEPRWAAECGRRSREPDAGHGRTDRDRVRALDRRGAADTQLCRSASRGSWLRSAQSPDGQDPVSSRFHDGAAGPDDGGDHGAPGGAPGRA